MPLLDKRYDSVKYRWILFVLLVVFIIALFFLTRILNRRRGRNGQQPVWGTAWMTPPSYYQSQQQYNQPMNASGPSDATYVPPYSESAQPYDAGYYDQNGVFHSNKNMEADAAVPLPEAVHHAKGPGSGNDLPFYFGGQQNSQQGTSTSYSGGFQRPNGAPPGVNFERPSGPPPGLDVERPNNSFTRS